MSERLLKLKGVSDQINYGSSVIYEWMAKGLFPEPIKINGKSQRWLQSDIDNWINAQVAANRDPDYRDN